MKISGSNNIYNTNINKNCNCNKTDDTSYNTNSKMTTPIMSQEAATALKTQCLSGQNISFKGQQKSFTEKDINFQVTCVGCENIPGNTRELYDYRCSMQGSYGLRWYEKFYKPHIIRNGNLDEKRNGETTAIVCPLKPGTPGYRGGDNMTIVINGNIDSKTINKLVAYMAKIGVLDSTPFYKKQYYVNSLEPKRFMANPKIKTAIAQFLNKTMLEEANKSKQAQQIEKVQPTKADTQNGYNLTEKSINIANIGCTQDKNNQYPVKDYIRDFLKNDRKFTVIHESNTINGVNKDSTAILIPSKKDEWEYLTVVLDGNIPEKICKDLVNTLVKNRMVNVDHPDFRKSIVEYFNNL